MRATLRWLVCAIAGPLVRILSALVKKDPRIVVLAGTDHQRYNENARYLFEYLSRKDDIDAYWFTSDRGIQAHLSSLGLKSVCGVAEKLRILLRAGMVIGCGSVYPDMCRAVGRRTVKVCLMHGVGPKVTTYFGDDLPGALAEIRRIARFDYVNFTSQHTAMLVGKVGYKLPPDKVVINGYPRVDRLLCADQMHARQRDKRVCRGLLGDVPDDFKVVLYTPTFRYRGLDRVPLEYLEGFDAERLSKFLVDQHAYLLYTVHLTDVRRKMPPLLGGQNLRCINYATEKFLDINELLPEVDVLFNDYSTTSTDVAVLGRPQIFVMPDYDEYAREHAFIEDYRAVMPGREATTFEHLLELTVEALNGHRHEDADRRSQFLDKYYDLSRGPSLDRHYQFMRRVLRPAGTASPV